MPSDPKTDKKYYTAEELDELYRKAESADREIYAEMRTNVRLVSGDHYNETQSKFWERIRESEDLNKQTKLRLTKNHVKKIVNEYVATVLSHAPGTMVMPNNPDEIQDQKAAELNNSVLDYYKKCLKLREKTREQAEFYFEFGEVFEKIYYDPDAGKVVDYEPVLGPNGEMILERDQNGQPTGNVVKDQDKPIMEGSLVIDNLYPFDMFRAAWSQSWDESPFYGYRKMIPNKILKTWVPEEDQSKVFGGTNSSYYVFNTDSSKYEATQEKTLIREFYFKPSKEYPNGYFYLTTENYKITEGELPYGIFPINYALCDKIPTSARGRSIIKQMRPYQIEINRAASAMATAQITTGDDKIILSHGSKMSNGGTLPGLRGVSVAGAMGDLKIIPGRVGDQYLPYLQNQVAELYAVMNMAEENFSDKEGKLDPYAMLFHSMKNRKKFSKYTEAFSEFKIKEAEILLEMAKIYLPDNKLIPVIGTSEMVNVAEFRGVQENKYIIKVEEVDSDAETMLGKQLAMNHTLQYVGASLSKEEIGKIVRAMPYLNEEEAFDDLTIDYDNSKNEMLALERTEVPVLNQYDNHEYIIKRLSNRMKKSDFRYLQEEVRNNYKIAMQAHQEMDLEQKQLVQKMQQGWIPTDGYMVVCDFYATKENGKTERVKLPYNAIKWLVDQLKVQGNTLEMMERQNQGALADMAQQMGAAPQTANIPPTETTGQAGPQTQGVY